MPHSSRNLRPPPSVPAAPTVLVVDDDEGTLLLVEEALRAEHWNVATTTSGADALAWLTKHPADLLVLDLKLHDMDGRTFVEALAGRSLATPFIIITGQGDERVAVEMMKRGALDYLVKDVNFITLMPAVVRRAFDQVARERRLAEAEESLRRSERRFRSTLDNMLEGCQTLSSDWRFLYINEAAAKHARRPAASLIGRRLMEVFPGIETTNLFAQLQTCMRDRVSMQMENEFVFPDGDSAWFQLSIQPDPEGLFILSLDITERKRLERELLEISERERRQFGHELHDGLGQRLTGLEMLSHGLAEDLKQHAAELADQASRLNRELRETVTQARLISHSLAPVPLDGDGLMRALAELAASTDRLPGVRCAFDCPKPVRMADVSAATHLYRIAQEAVNNALKHGRARKIQITLAEGPRTLEMTVSNNGRALPRARSSAAGAGLSVMRYRAGVIGAHLALESGQRSGVKVSCSWPKK